MLIDRCAQIQIAKRRDASKLSRKIGAIGAIGAHSIAQLRVLGAACSKGPVEFFRNAIYMCKECVRAAGGCERCLTEHGRACKGTGHICTSAAIRNHTHRVIKVFQ